MLYQSNDRVVEESSDSLLLRNNNNSDNINNGASNSAKGSGTTTTELVTKFRLLNCTTSLFIFLFHTLRIVLNPIRFTLLLSSPGKLILECIVGVLALCLFCVEARVPVLGEKMLRLLSRGGSGGGGGGGGERYPCIDLDVARGRLLALMIMGGCLGLINYLGHENNDDTNNGGMHSGIPSSNVTGFGEDYSTSSEKEDDHGNGSAHHMHLLYIIVHCIVLSPNTLIVFALAGYTMYVMNAFPEYAEVRAYSIQDESDSSGAGAASTTTTTTAVPSWVSNVGNIVQARVQGGGYQNV